MKAATQAWIAKCTGETVPKRDGTQDATTSVAAAMREAVSRCFFYAECTFGGTMVNTSRDAISSARWATEAATRIVTGAR